MPERNEALEHLIADPCVRRLFAALDGNGEEVRVVGGAVRNALLREEHDDVDLATTATPDVVEARARKAGLKVVPTGVEFGSLTLVVDGRPFEITSLREDVETDGRRALVRFGRDFAADALRRDFTINALSVDGRGKLYDYVGGMADLSARSVRFIGDPGQRIAEDYLRILRFFRFSARYGGGELDRDGFRACIAGRAGLDILSRERIGAELLKLLAAPQAAGTATKMADAGLLGPLLGLAPWPARLTRLEAIETAGNPPDPLLRLAALALHVEEDSARLQNYLRLSNAQTDRLARMAEALASWHELAGPPGYGLMREALFRYGRTAALDALRLLQAENGGVRDAAEFASARAFLQDTPEPKLPVSGGDLLARGFREGAGMGRALKQLQALWIRAGFPEDPQSLAQLIEEVTKPI